MFKLSEDINDYCFFDTETRALEGLSDWRWGDITKTSAARYARSSKVIMIQYAIGDGPVTVWELEDFDKHMRWVDAPPDLLEFMARALKGEAWFVAFNSAFDRLVCNHAMVRPSKRTVLPIRTVLDASAQAAASNLPGKLDRAHKFVGGAGKTPAGKSLIQLFCTAGGATPQSEPEQWEKFVDYGVQDIIALREVFKSTRALTPWEWEEFWASEAVNDRGLPMDRQFLERAAYLADLYMAAVEERVQEITGYDKDKGTGVRTVNQHVLMAQWVFDRLSHHPEAVAILSKRFREDEEGELVLDKISVDRKRVEKLIPFLERIDKEVGLTDEEFAVLQLLEVREYGASATPKKFAKALGMLLDNDRLPGQYVFNGAQQTGRYASRGVQVHNLTRKALKNEAEAIEAILDIVLPSNRASRCEVDTGEDEDV